MSTHRIITHSFPCALNRVRHHITHNKIQNYTHYAAGILPTEELHDWLNELSADYAILANATERHKRKKHHLPNAFLTVYLAPDSITAHWMLLVSGEQLSSPDGLKFHRMSRSQGLHWRGYSLKKSPQSRRWAWSAELAAKKRNTIRQRKHNTCLPQKKSL